MGRKRRKDVQDQLALAMHEVEKVKIVTSVEITKIQVEKALQVEDEKLQKKGIRGQASFGD